MRNFRTQATVNYIRLWTKTGYWKKWLAAYGWQWVRPVEGKIDSESGIYNLDDIGKSRKLVGKLGEFDGEWWQRIFEPETKGVRVWEYGKVLSAINLTEIEGKKVLDVGTGGSLLPEFLASLGAKVTSVDLEKRMESVAHKNKKITEVVADMTKMPFKDNSFEIVISVSAIEHLDNKDNFWEATTEALNEMKRVVKKGGMILVTTDSFLKRQKNDNWVGSGDKIEGAFKWEKTAEMAKILNADFDSKTERRELIRSETRANFRGRFFTTVFFNGKKNS